MNYSKYSPFIVITILILLIYILQEDGHKITKNIVVNTTSIFKQRITSCEKEVCHTFFKTYYFNIIKYKLINKNKF